MSWTITLPLLPDGMNKRERTHYRVRSKELERITEAIDVLAQAAEIPIASGRRSVRITIHKSLRSRVTDDPANRDSRAKSPLDALVKLGYLVDDSERWLVWLGVHEGERRVDPCTVIVLEDVGDGVAGVDRSGETGSRGVADDARWSVGACPVCGGAQPAQGILVW